MLHAQRLVVQHPIHQTPLEIIAPVAPDMQELIDLLETRPLIHPTGPKRGR